MQPDPKQVPEKALERVVDAAERLSTVARLRIGLTYEQIQEARAALDRRGGDADTPQRKIDAEPVMTQRGAGESGSPLPLIPSTYWRDIPCGHPPDPVALYGSGGRPVCHCGRTLDPADGAGLPQPPEAPGTIVNCDRCGCYVAIPPKPAPTQPSPESGSEEPLAEIADELRAYPEVQWDRFIEYDGKLRAYGWLARSDGRADFLLLDFDVATGKLLEWITSAHPHPASVVERLEGEQSVECQRVEDTFEIPNAVRLQPESGSGEEGAQDFGAREGAASSSSEASGLQASETDADALCSTPKGDSRRLAQTAPTQPLQGSEVGREKTWFSTAKIATSKPEGPWIKLADHQAKLQQVEEERDDFQRQLLEAMRSREGFRRYQDILGENCESFRVRATRAEAALAEAAKEFDERAEAERDERGKLWRVGDVYKQVAQYLREKQAALSASTEGER